MNDTLAHLKILYEMNPTREDTSGEEFAEYEMKRLQYTGCETRDEDGYLLEEESERRLREAILELFFCQHQAGFNRTLNRMKLLKDELVAKTTLLDST